ncbi:hypothetical protein H5410_045746 [Solanum commersonii]|uniref:Uncharacterized protein n=1 Tax=Solanum commersonii TaxID=4109 RepID=A0A9J5XEK2_SOLCO|nr:hypothetical protein H5410_045746 [Solanum commersonii]
MVDDFLTINILSGHDADIMKPNAIIPLNLKSNIEPIPLKTTAIVDVCRGFKFLYGWSDIAEPRELIPEQCGIVRDCKI